MHGHDVVIFDARPKIGGLNEYGIAAYKTVDDFAQAEVDFILSIGGISVETGKQLGRDFTIAELRQDFDAVFLGLGLAGVNALGLADEDVAGVADAVAYIAGLRQSHDLSTLPVGRRVVVVGGGMTAIDIATQSKRLGASQVTIVYRRSPERMGASRFERELAQTDGVTIIFNARPVGLTDIAGRVTGIAFEHTREQDGRLVGTGETFTLEADMVFKAIGQTFDGEALNGAIAGVALEGGRVKVDSERRTNMPGVWAGGDCVADGNDLTVVAVADGRDAAESIHRALVGSAADGA
jgi:glutamate synthase (NADPH/NADH) small chain